MALVLLSSCAAEPTDLTCGADDRCIRYGISADIPILDPHLAETKEAGIVLRQIYDSLVYRDPDTHEFLPGLAAEWQISADGLNYTFHLRTDIRFHDGSAFDAAAVAANIERILKPELSASFARRLLGPLKRYEILGEYIIRLTLDAPFPAFLESLSQPYLGMSSRAALSNYSDMRHQFHLSGTGPFRLTEYLPGERVMLRRFEEYRVNPLIYLEPAGEAIDRVEFAIARGDEADALTELDNTLDVIDNVPPAEAQNLASNSRVQVLPIEIPGASFQFLFNTRRDHVSRRDVRLALLLATNRAAIVDQVYFNFSPVAWAPLSESTGYSHTGYINRYGFDLDAAQNLLEAAGYGDSDGDGILDYEETPLSLTIVVPPWGGMPAAAALLQRQWRAIGIDLGIEPVPGTTRLRSFIQSGQYDLVPVEDAGIDPQLLNNIFMEGGGYAAAQAPESLVNAMLLELMRHADPKLRRSHAYAIQARIMDEVLILPMREIVRLTAAKANLVNLRFDAYGFYPLLQNLSIAE